MGKGIPGGEKADVLPDVMEMHTCCFNSVKAELKKQKRLGFAFSGSHLVKFWQLSHIQNH